MQKTGDYGKIFPENVGNKNRRLRNVVSATYAFLVGTLMLFLILCLMMVLTRNLQEEEPDRDKQEAGSR